MKIIKKISMLVCSGALLFGVSSAYGKQETMRICVPPLQNVEKDCNYYCARAKGKGWGWDGYSASNAPGCNYDKCGCKKK